MYKSNIGYGKIPFLNKLVSLFTISLPLRYTLDKFLPKMHCASFGSMFVVMTSMFDSNLLAFNLKNRMKKYEYLSVQCVTR